MPASLPDAGATGYGPARDLTSRADRTVLSIFDTGLSRHRDAWSVVALGGYGRRELCPFSDLDILFLLGRELSRGAIEESLKEILYPLWDAGFTAGYSVRTIPEVLRDAREDFFLHTSLMDARYICGSRSVFDRLTSELAADRHLNRSSRFISTLAFHTRKRHELFGDASYFLEPHVKDGRGGLRDSQSIFWIRSALFRDRRRPQSLPLPADLPEICEASLFLLRTRFTLHQVAGRKADRMHLDYQEALASRMGYAPGSSEMAVEVFLRDFHTYAARIGFELDTLLRCLDRPGTIRSRLARKKTDGPLAVSAGVISFSRPGQLEDDPLAVMAAFRRMARDRSFLSPEARCQVRETVSADSALRENPSACSIMLEILKEPHAKDALASMLETGVLEQLVPEFSAIRGRAIFDVFHTCTVDLHSIHTVSELKALEESEPEIFSLVRDRDVLYLGAFLHDIGKGIGAAHEITGAEMIGPIAARFGLGPDRTGMAAFLVRNHLVMTDLALRRDLSEEKVISDFARLVSSPERLSMLCLLTMADSRATGPLAWSRWKKALLLELYAKTLNILEKGIFKDPKNALCLDEKWRRLIAVSGSDPGVSGRLWALPQSYVLATEVREIQRHLAMSASLATGDGARIQVRQEEGHSAMTFVTRDRPGLFALLTGLLAANRLDIISAHIFTWYDGTVVDSFRVLAPWDDYHGWETLDEQLVDLLSGKTDIRDRLSRVRALRAQGLRSPSCAREATLGLDNDTSDFFTIVEVRAPWRRGLIHDVSRALSESGASIHRAFITNSADLVSCGFYVVDVGGEKITGNGRQEALLDAVRESTHGRGLTASPGGQNRV